MSIWRNVSKTLCGQALLASVITACGGGHKSAEAAHETAQPSSQSPATEQSAAKPASSALQPVPLHEQAESALASTPALGVSRLGAMLLRDPSFTDAALPASDPDRYRHWAQMARITVGKSHLQYAEFLDDERLILARSEAEAGVRVYQTASRKLLAHHTLGLGPFNSATLLPWSSHDTRFLLGSDLFDAKTGTQVGSLPVRDASRMRWSPDGNVLTVCSTPAPDQPSRLTFYLKQGEQLQELGAIQMPGRVEGWDLSRDNRLLAVSTYPQESVVVFDLQNAQGELEIPAQRFAGSVAISPDGRWLAVGGQGLLLVDLANPARRAYYSYYYNNIDSVVFSPSGDAVVTSSYDGRIRIFAYEAAGPTLRLIKTLSHDNHANVYSIQFTQDGNSLLSASGDQTLRLFGAKPSAKSTLRSPPGRFRSIDDWRANLPKETLPAVAAAMRDGHYYPPQLDAAPRPSKIRPGLYACHISDMYKLRDCTVRKTPSGHTLLEFASDNLLGVLGVLYDDGPVARYEAWLTEPSTIVGCQGCERQPLHGLLRGTGRNFKGVLTFRNYYDPRVPPPLPDANAKSEDADDRFELILNYKGPLPEEAPSALQKR